MFNKFNQMKDLAGMLGNLGEMKEKADQLKTELEARVLTGQAGGGAVTVKVTGKLEVESVHLDPAILQALLANGSANDQQMIEQLIAEAANNALQAAKDLMQEKMGELMGGGDLPFNLPGM